MLASLPQIRFGLLVGIGAGVRSPDFDLRLGDVAVSRPEGRTGGVVQYDLKKVLQGKNYERKGFLSAPSEVLLNAVSHLRSRHEYQSSRMTGFLEDAFERHPDLKPAYLHQGTANDRLFKSSYEHIDGENSKCQLCDPEKVVDRHHRESAKPKIHYGLIASGNTLF